jgi:hypothetical protein
MDITLHLHNLSLVDQWRRWQALGARTLLHLLCILLWVEVPWVVMLLPHNLCRRLSRLFTSGLERRAQSVKQLLHPRITVFTAIVQPKADCRVRCHRLRNHLVRDLCLIILVLRENRHGIGCTLRLFPFTFLLSSVLSSYQ